MKRIQQYYVVLRSSSFFQSILKVAGGTLLAQAIALGASPILTRLYEPEVFGIVGVLMAIAVPVGTLINGKYEMAIVLPAKKSESIVLLKVTSVMVAVVGLLVLLLSYLFRFEIAAWINLPLFASYFWVVPLIAILNGYQGVLSHWIIRNKYFGTYSISAPLSAGGGALYKIAFGFYQGSVLHLIVGNAITVLLQLFIFVKTLPKRAVGICENTTSSASTLSLLKRYRDFPLYRAPQMFLNSLSRSIPGILLAVFYSPAALGQFWLAQRIVASPATLISNAVRKVFFQRASELANNEENLYDEIWSKTRTLILIGVPVFVVLSAICPLLFGFIFGAEWKEAGYVASWLCLWYFSSFANTPAISSIPVISLQKDFFIIEIVSTGVRIGSVFFVGKYFSFMTTVAIFSLIGFVTNSFVIAYVLYQVKKNNICNDDE